MKYTLPVDRTDSLTLQTLTIVLAGGEGNRLRPLTRDRAKPAVPFGGQYRLIDFVLSNLVNAGLRQIVVLTQYKSHSLDRHLAQTWRLASLLGHYITPVPAQMRVGRRWFSGSADAIFQNLNIIDDEDPEYVVVFGSDHIYRMDVRQMLHRHRETGAEVTVAAIPVPRDIASSFGIVDADSEGKIVGFLEKPEDPPPMLERPEMSFASMGNYVFTRSALVDMLRKDAEQEDSRHDLGGDIIPAFVEKGTAAVYDFAQNRVSGQGERERGYWRDVGTIEAYYQASMDLVSVDPLFDLYNEDWPIYSLQLPLPPAKFVHDSEDRRGQAFDSLVSQGVIVSGGTVRKSILSHRVRVRTSARVEESVLFDDVEVGRGATVRNAIIDKGVRVPENYQIGTDASLDRERFHLSDSGIVVIGKKDQLP